MQLVNVGQILSYNKLCNFISVLPSQRHKNLPWDLDGWPTLYSIETFARYNLIGFLNTFQLNIKLYYWLTHMANTWEVVSDFR